jgi:hypothetical protein
MSLVQLAVVHWFPIEYYPPITNFLEFIKQDSRLYAVCFTCHNTKDRAPFESTACRIVRYSFPQSQQNILARLWSYVAFPFAVFCDLMRMRPEAILYVEPQSAFPVFLYMLLVKRCRIFIHHHEYHDPHQFLRRGMRLVRFYHWLEKVYIFRRAEWISHTNRDRIRLFQSDFPEVDPSKVHELPNYPPKSWIATVNKAWVAACGKLRLVYVGSLSCKDTYIKEVVDWVSGDNGAGCELHVYSYNYTKDVADLFKDIRSDRIFFTSQGVPYEKLPEILSEFHVGLILYKGTTTNYVFNASNKLFEYLALGLDVWYPAQMFGVRQYARLDQAPRVVELDFDGLASVGIASLCDRSQIPFVPRTESCESVLTRLVEGVVGPHGE